jgi:predicted chitinase/murein DD-endopeptidase MepM/ murein hydrolase activator NlpD
MIMSTIHTIRSGETLSGIAQRYNTTVDKLARANNIQNPDLIQAGRQLTIPDGFDAQPRPSSGPQAGDGFESGPSRPSAPGSIPTAASGQFNGTSAAPGTTNVNAWIPVDAPLKGDPSNRNAETYADVIDQFAVGSNPRHLPRDGNTYCNIFAWDVTKAMGAEIPHWVDGAGNPMPANQGREMDANAGHLWLQNQGPQHGWREVSAQEAQALANQGHPAVASWYNPGGIGHIAVVRPGELTSRGPATAQAGGTNFSNGHMRDGFGNAQPRYFVNDSGQVEQPKPPPLHGDPAVTQLVNDAYRTHLRRDADEGGLRNWNDAAQGLAAQGQSHEQISAWLGEQFGGSQEAQALRVTDETFQEVLGRDVSNDRGYWHEAAVKMMRDEGKSADQVRETLRGEFMRSPEYAMKQVDQVVSDTFREVLGRESDPSDYWHGVGRQMVGEGKSLDEVRDFMRAQFKGSEEYQLNHPEELVAGQYRELLGREPDAGGLESHVALANGLRAQGKGVNDIRSAIAESIKSSAEYKNRTGGVSVEQLRAIMPNLSDARARELLPHLNSAMKEAGIDTPLRQAAFLAQLAHESGEFRYMEEIASGAAYEGRADLGNTQPGDGVRFKGRGPIQLTGRNNYRAAGQALGIDLENNPRRAADPDVGFRTAAWFWNSRNLNAAADARNFDYITYRVNGGYNGKASRDMYYARALRVLGA